MERRYLYLVAGLSMMLAVEAQFDTSLLNCRPSVVAAALLYAERRQRGAVPFWPSMLAKLTGYEDLTTPELACAVKSAQKLCRKAHYMQLYKTQSSQIAAQLALPPSQQQQLAAGAGAVLKMSAAGLLGQQQGLEQQSRQQQQQQALSNRQQQQQAAVGLASGMQADAVVAAPHTNMAPTVLIPPSGLGLQPSLSAPLSARAMSASSSGSGVLGMGVLNSVGSTPGVAPPGLLGLHAGSGVGAGLVPGMQQPSPVQQNQVDLALLAQLQLQQQIQHEQQRQQQLQQEQQHQQQQQQQARSMAALGAGFMGSHGMQLGAGPGPLALNGSLQTGMYAAAPNSMPASRFVSGAELGSLNGFAAPGVSPFSLHMQPGLLQQAQAQEQQDVAGLENLALTLSALGLHGTADGQISTAALEAALRQQC
jgi:pentatricopeptide repeat domain-containing protein 1